MESPLIRAHLRRCIPPALSKVRTCPLLPAGNGQIYRSTATLFPRKLLSSPPLSHLTPLPSSQAALSRGLQHPRPSVQLLTLQLLEGALACVSPLLQAAQQKAAQEREAAAGAVSGGEGGGEGALPWASFLQGLCVFLRGRVPDPHTLLALHASLERKEQVGGDQAKVPTQPESGKKKRGGNAASAPGEEEEEGEGISAGGLTLGRDSEQLATENEGSEAELADLEGTLFGEGGVGEPGASTRGSQVLLRLLKVTAAPTLLLSNEATPLVMHTIRGATSYHKQQPTIPELLSPFYLFRSSWPTSGPWARP